MRGLSLVAASGGLSSSRCAGLSLSRPLLLRSTGSRRAGSVVVAHGPSRSAARGIFPDQGSNPCPLHWQADSQPLRHQGSPCQDFDCDHLESAEGRIDISLYCLSNQNHDLLYLTRASLIFSGLCLVAFQGRGQAHLPLDFFSGYLVVFNATVNNISFDTMFLRRNLQIARTGLQQTRCDVFAFMTTTRMERGDISLQKVSPAPSHPVLRPCDDHSLTSVSPGCRATRGPAQHMLACVRPLWPWAAMLRAPACTFSSLSSVQA